jgi:hypothetical protein
VSKAYAKVQPLRCKGEKYNIFGIMQKIAIIGQSDGTLTLTLMQKIVIIGQNELVPLLTVIFDPQ